MNQLKLHFYQRKQDNSGTKSLLQACVTVVRIAAH